MTDRLSYAFGMKLPGAEPYSSIDFHVSLTSDVKEEETSDEAFKRIKDTVEQWSDDEYTRISEIREG